MKVPLWQHKVKCRQFKDTSIKGTDRTYFFYFCPRQWLAERPLIGSVATKFNDRLRNVLELTRNEYGLPTSGDRDVIICREAIK